MSLNVIRLGFGTGMSTCMFLLKRGIPPPLLDVIAGKATVVPSGSGSHPNGSLAYYVMWLRHKVIQMVTSDAILAGWQGLSRTLELKKDRAKSK